MTIFNRYIEVIKDKNPMLAIEKYSINSEGQNNDIIIINDDIIFKFPKYGIGVEKLRKEVEILNKLNRHITLHIPKYEYVSIETKKVGQVYGGYKIIRGCSFKKQIFEEINEKQNIATQLALFLKELHSISIDEFKESDLDVNSIKDWEELFIKIEEKLFPFMSLKSQKEVSENFNNFFESSICFSPTIIHGDFGPSNIIFDLNERKISGIIDFNEISIGDPANDIAALIGPFGYGEKFIRLFEPIYSNVESLIGRAKFYASTFPLQEALFGIEANDQDAFNSGIKQYL